MKRLILASAAAATVAVSALVGGLNLAHADTPYPPFTPEPPQFCLVGGATVPCAWPYQYTPPGLGVEYMTPGVVNFSGGWFQGNGTPASNR